ncbi:MAG: HDOD domain-containing protein [Planctomycetota bacterium]
MAALTDAIAALERLPAMPATSLQLIAMLAGGGRDADLGEVERIVRRDEAVAAAVLRRANSAAFSLPGRIYGLGEAVRRLGARNLCRIAFEAQASGYLAGGGSAYGLHRGALSQAALGGAIAADTLARRHGADAELCFVAALLRDIGKLAIDAVAGESALDALSAKGEAEGRDFLALEREAFGADHAELGAMLCARWGLPAAIVRAVAGNHRPPADHADPITDVVHAADCVARWAGLGVGNDGLMYAFDAGTRDRLHTSRDELEALVADVLAAVAPADHRRTIPLGRTA